MACREGGHAKGGGGTTGEPLTGAWMMVRKRRDGGGASDQKGEDVGTTERRRGQADGVEVFHRGVRSFYNAGGGAPGS
jgi:hypothetical protein